ncbi:MAG TPA: DUF427 domain-containing protein [Anaerolineales bacterium]
MPKAIWKGTVLAESEKTIMVEGNHYFPPETIFPEYFSKSESHTVCPWKGVASYYNIRVGDQLNYDAAWFYAQPSPAAKMIKDYIAFWRGVEIVP